KKKIKNLLESNYRRQEQIFIDQVKRVRWLLKTNKAANTKSKELSAELRG
ncbi:unnamed protein product, partial [Brassica napus]